MCNWLRNAFTVVLISVMCLPGLSASADVRSETEQYLTKGKLADARQFLLQKLEEETADAEAQYALGIVTTLQAVENLAQNLYRYGLRRESPRLPFVRIPVPDNANPEPLTYEKWRQVLEEFIADLESAAETLARVQADDVKLKLPVGLIRLDLDGDGTAGEEETFWRVFTAVAWRAAKLDENQKRFEIGFDKADVHWLIGYTHLLRAMAEAWLAHDTSEFYQYTAAIFFKGAVQPEVTLGGAKIGNGFEVDQFVDAIAAIHLMRFDVAEPARMQRARTHLLSMIQQSRKVWEYATAETDDDREWIPNATQTSLTPLTVTQERVDGWAAFLDEAEAVLNGERLIPHWRLKRPLGVNLKRVFENPQRFDLVLWIHGGAALPFIEEGEVVSRETGSTLNRIFQGRFVTFAIWFQ